MAELFRRIFRALCQNWVAWLVLFFSTGIKGLVNSVEQPFARSLTVCDKELEADMYTGSRWCGDRLEVIQSGMYLSAVGQGQENFAMLCSLTFVIIITGIWGPRISLALGLCGVTVSTALFVVASSSPDLGRSLFAMGQGLQGLYPIEYLMGILMLHMSILPGADGEANFQIMSYMGIFGNIFWQVVLGSGVQLLELTDYGKIWMGIFLVNASILALTLFAFPEMKPLDQDRFSDKSPLMKVIHEVLSYKDLALDWRARRYLVKIFFEQVVSVYPWTVSSASMMAYHGWSQMGMAFWFFWPQIINLFSIPYYNKWLVDRFGHRKTYVWTCRYFITSQAWSALSLLWTDKGFIFYNYMSAVLGGFFPLKGFVDSRFAEPEQMQRFQSVQWIMGYFLGMWSGPMFASRFDATAQTAWERSTPALLLLGWVAVQYWSVFYLIYDMDGVQGFAVTVRVLDEADAKGKQLWWLVGHGNGADEAGFINEDKWGFYNLQAILGKQLWEVGGTIHSCDHWMAILASMNQTPSQGHLLLQRLDAAIAYVVSAQQQAQEAIQKMQAASEFPELEGEWRPIRSAEWTRPHEAVHQQTIEVWGRNGEGHFANGDWEAGVLKVVHKNGNEYFLMFKLLHGPAAGLEGPLAMRMDPDGTRSYPEPRRFLKRKDPVDATAEAGLPVPEGKKDA